jgi:hypothetical protein
MLKLKIQILVNGTRAPGERKKTATRINIAIIEISTATFKFNGCISFLTPGVLSEFGRFLLGLSPIL